jgi:dihydrolipoamide dehydrogenase
MAENENYYDIAVLGAGPGGYPAAIKAAQLGKRVALIEANELGGTCLNRGCIPSKALISNADKLKLIRDAQSYGIHISGDISIDFPQMIARKNGVVEKVRKNLEGLLKSNQITIVRGFGKFISPHEIKVTGQDNVIIRADKIIIATGSEPRNIPAFPFDQKQILDSTALLNIDYIPESIAIVGGGIIGCEFASLFNALGSKVTIIEMLPSILPTVPTSVSSVLVKAFQKKGIEIIVNAAVQSIDKTATGVMVKLPEDKHVSAEIALVAVGRKLNTDQIGLERAGLAPDKSGIIPVNEKMETSVDGIYAIGDIASKWWLAHVASHQGLIAAENACGHEARMHYNAVPSVIFTDPEIGIVGMSLEEANAAGYRASIGTFPFQALGKAQAALMTDGFAQIVIDSASGQILGAQVVGHDAGTLVGEMGVAIANELTVGCIAETMHAHPTIAEVWMEAALVANETPLHLPPKRVRR